MEFQTGGAPVHHAVVHLDRTPGSRKRDGADGQPGFDGMGAPDTQEPDGHFIAVVSRGPSWIVSGDVIFQVLRPRLPWHFPHLPASVWLVAPARRNKPANRDSLHQ